MPSAPLKPCSWPGCPELTHSRHCDRHTRQESKDIDARRGSSASRGYGARWRRIRDQVLREEPLCRECKEKGRVEPARDVDHVVSKLVGGTDDRSNLQALCHACHSRKTAIEDGRWK